MKLQIINEERQPESVAPKIKVFDSEADLDAALPDLKDGAIVATKEDETVDGRKSKDLPCTGELSNGKSKYTIDISEVTSKMKNGDKIMVTFYASDGLSNGICMLIIFKNYSGSIADAKITNSRDVFTVESVDANSIVLTSAGTVVSVRYASYIEV